MTRVVFSRALCIVVNPLLGSVSLEAEVDLVLRRVHVFLEILFPNLRPRAAEHVGYFELNRFAGRDLRREAVNRIQSARALGPTQSVGLGPALLIVAMPE